MTVYDFPRESGYNKPELDKALNRNFRVGRGVPDLPLTIERINALRELPQGWNSYDAAAPNPEAISHAILWVRQIALDASLASLRWSEPHVSADAEGDVVLEWWQGDKKLTIYVSADSVHFVKVWGPNIVDDMADGQVSSEIKRRALWRWLMD